MVQNDYDGAYGDAAPAQTSNMAMFSLIAGVLSWFFFPFIGAIVAIILGHMGLGEIRNSGGRLGGRGMAVIGLVLGYGQLALMVLGIVLAVLLVVFLSASAVEMHDSVQAVQEARGPAEPGEAGEAVPAEEGAPNAVEEGVEEEADREEGDGDDDGAFEAPEFAEPRLAEAADARFPMASPR